MTITTITAEAHQLLKDALKELEAPKGSVQAGVQKLLRAARMLGDEDVAIWCEIQLGNAKYVAPLASAVKSDSLMYALISRDIRKRIQELPKAPTKPTKQEKTKTERSAESSGEPSDWDKKVRKGQGHLNALTALGLKEEIHYPIEEREIKRNEAGGGYKNVGTIEEILASLVRKKLGKTTAPSIRIISLSILITSEE